MTRVAAFMICILSAFAMVCPSAAKEGTAVRPVQQAEQLVPSSRVKAPQLGDFGSIEDWTLKRMQSPGKTAKA